MSVLMMQGLVAVLLVGLAYLSRSDAQMARIYLASILIPVGWTGAIWTAFTRGEAARREGTWTKEWDAKERNRTYGIMGGVIAVWIAILAAIVFLAP